MQSTHTGRDGQGKETRDDSGGGGRTFLSGFPSGARACSLPGMCIRDMAELFMLILRAW